METERAADGYPSVGDAAPLERYEAVTTREGELLVYDVETEDAWIQADSYCSLESRV